MRTDRQGDPVPEGELDEDEGCFHLEGVWKAVQDTPASIRVERQDLEGYDPNHSLWIPQSQVHEDSEVYAKGTEGSLIVTAWLAREREWCD